MWDIAVTELQEVDAERAAANRAFLEQGWEDQKKFYHEMVFEKVAGASWSSPMYNYCPSSVTSAVLMLSHIIVALNELRLISVAAKYNPKEIEDQRDALVMFGSHVLGWRLTRRGSGNLGDVS